MTNLDEADGPAERIRRVERGLVVPSVLRSQAPRTATLAERMEFHRVPGISIAVINNYQLEWVTTHGVLEAGGSDVVTTGTLFQGGSIGKPVVALRTS